MVCQFGIAAEYYPMESNDSLNLCQFGLVEEKE
jgi:hypothetical protein